MQFRHPPEETRKRLILFIYKAFRKSTPAEAISKQAKKDGEIMATFAELITGLMVEHLIARYSSIQQMRRHSLISAQTRAQLRTETLSSITTDTQ